MILDQVSSNVLTPHAKKFVFFYAILPGTGMATEVNVPFGKESGFLITVPVGERTFLAGNCRFAMYGSATVCAKHCRRDYTSKDWRSIRKIEPSPGHPTELGYRLSVSDLLKVAFYPAARTRGIRQRGVRLKGFANIAKAAITSY